MCYLLICNGGERGQLPVALLVREERRATWRRLLGRCADCGRHGVCVQAVSSVS